MLSDEVRRRLGQLHAIPPRAIRASLGEARQAAPQAVLYRDHTRLWNDSQEWESASGRHLRLRRPLADVWPAADAIANRAVNRPCDAQGAGAHVELAAVADHFPAGTLFLDLETCGFAGSPVFLAGLVWHADGRLVLDQLFARDFAEERAMLETLWQVASCNRVLVTFNGKSFDWPMVQDRSTRHHLGRLARGKMAALGDARVAPLGRLDPRPQLAHCDLLHHARRRWKHVLPNCKLQTLERHICNRARRDDLDGSQVPAAYHEFVRTGATPGIEAVLRHNALDLVTLVEVAIKLLEPHGVARRSA